MVNINEAVVKIRKVGPSNVRAVPSEGQTTSGRYNIEIKEGNTWNSIAECPNRKMADDIISIATNRTILG